MANLAAFALVVFVSLGLLGLTCWALLWIWAEKSNETSWIVSLETSWEPDVFQGQWLDCEPFTGDLAWPKCPRAICDWSQDA